MATNQPHLAKTKTDAYLRGTLVQGEIKERWMQLCEMVSVRQRRSSQTRCREHLS